jgi:hypothetical protein
MPMGATIGFGPTRRESLSAKLACVALVLLAAGCLNTRPENVSESPSTSASSTSTTGQIGSVPPAVPTPWNFTQVPSMPAFNATVGASPARLPFHCLLVVNPPEEYGLIAGRASIGVDEEVEAWLFIRYLAQRGDDEEPPIVTVRALHSAGFNVNATYGVGYSRPLVTDGLLAYARFYATGEARDAVIWFEADIQSDRWGRPMCEGASGRQFDIFSTPSPCAPSAKHSKQALVHLIGADSQPIAGVTLQASWRSMESPTKAEVLGNATSDSNGCATFPLQGPGQYLFAIDCGDTRYAWGGTNNLQAELRRSLNTPCLVH